MSLYDHLIVLKRVPYVLYWILAGMILFILDVFLLFVFKETGISYLQIFLSICAMVGVFIGWQTTSRGFKSVIQKLDSIVEMPSSSWVEEKYLDLFTLRTPIAKLSIIAGCIGIIVTMLIIGLPFQTIGMTIATFIELFFFLAICAHGAYFYFYLLILLKHIAKFPVKDSFYRVNHPAIISLYQYYSGITMTVLFLYIALVAVVWQSPYGLNSAISIWVIILAFYPLAYFIWSYFQIHNLMYQMKQSNIESINQQVLDILSTLKSKPSKETAEILRQLMEIQEKIENLREWPLSIQGTLTFLISTAIPIFQIVIALFK